MVPKPPWSSLGRRLESMCRKALFDFSLLDHIEQVAIALSGGKDSLTLLFFLKAILGRGVPSLPLTAIHVQGPFSCGASVHRSFLELVCEELQVPLHVCVSTGQKETSCYPCSRKRRKLLFDKVKELGMETIAFGHHRDDMIQTLLLNLFHKGEFAANLPKVPMHDYGVTIIRPLMYITESEIVSFAKLHGFFRITCQCPIGAKSKRAEVKSLLSRIQEAFPHVESNLALAAQKYGSKKALENR